nr:hypothetical protein [Clostridium polynesiense]
MFDKEIENCCKTLRFSHNLADMAQTTRIQSGVSVQASFSRNKL